MFLWGKCLVSREKWTILEYHRIRINQPVSKREGGYKISVGPA